MRHEQLSCSPLVCRARAASPPPSPSPIRPSRSASSCRSRPAARSICSRASSAQKLQESLGQPVIIENRAGAGGNTGADVVAKSPPDGYTILQNTNGQAISPAIYKSLPFDPVQRFHPGDAARRHLDRAGGHPEAAGEDRARPDRAREGQARQPQLRHDRRRQPAAPDHGDVQARGRHRHSRRSPIAATRRSTPR